MDSQICFAYTQLLPVGTFKARREREIERWSRGSRVVVVGLGIAISLANDTENHVDQLEIADG